AEVTPARSEPTPAAPAAGPTSEEEPMERSFAGTTPAPDFPAGLEWLNTDRPLSLDELRGKVVLLDFWTYGCINCMHVIPELKRLEEKFAQELVVIGVHSAKFENEGETENIRQIILRYELEHPVINDKEFRVWAQYGANAWPTFVLIDPAGNVFGYHSGEGIYDLFDAVIGGMVAQFDAQDRIDRRPLALKLEGEGQPDSPLRFPGKLLADVEGGRLFIADSSHNRIVVAGLDGAVLEVIGSGQPALVDGPFESAAFFRPQGLALADPDTLYVADTSNHAIRKVDLAGRQVETVAGTGRQRYTTARRGPALNMSLNSPWDVLYHEGVLYIAMAGQHQIWALDPAAGQIEVFSGSGREELRDGPHGQAGLNQPSGLATDGRTLFIADSEASAIRAAELDADGGVSTIVGVGLFDFGDVDGRGDEVRLQHPLGVAYRDGQLYVADTYNSKIKRLNIETQASATWLGGGAAGWRDGAEALFNEPGGLSLGDDRLYIADTNNHVIRVADLASGEVTTLVLVDSQGLLTRQPAGTAYSGEVIEVEAQAVRPGVGEVTLDLALPEGYKLNDLAPLSVELSSEDGLVAFPEGASLTAAQPELPLRFPAEFQAGAGQLTAELVVYYCREDAEGLCLIERARLVAPLEVAAGAAEGPLELAHTLTRPE
ncbi:MAG: thioredoxin-like domain-containing protein, partial [Candidatus Promineifilaceae bacterium]